MSVPIIVKILISLALILVGNKLLKNLSAAVALATVALAFWTGHSPRGMGQIVTERFFSLDNGLLLAVVILVIWLSSQMDKTGIMRDLVGSLRAFLSPRSAMAVLPAVIGLLPMPGGALFSAPLVDDCDEKDEVPALLKSQINYWFRHVWELTWPLYPGVILATDIAGLEVWQVFLVGIPMMATSITAGYFFILKKARISAGHTTPSNHRFVVMMLPIITVIVVYLLITIFLPGVGQINKYLPMLIGIAAAILVLQYRRPLGWSEWKGVLFSRRALNMAVIVALIRIYGAFIEARLPGGTMLMDQMRMELNTLGIPLILLIMVLPFISGLTTGISVGFVGASLPIAFSLLGPEASLAERLGTLMLTYPFGFIGVMLSPVHVCFIVTSEHFKTSLVKSMGRILIPSAIVLAASFAIGILLLG